jgi:pimeloyl-ACP methyl ester carboxylesterase
MSPTLVIVPGSFSTSDMYDPVVLPLREKGYTIHVLDLPCYPNNYAKGRAPPSMHDDAKAVSEFVGKLVDQVIYWSANIVCVWDG